MGEAAQPGRVQVSVVTIVVIVVVYRRVHVQLKTATATVQTNLTLKKLKNTKEKRKQIYFKTSTYYKIRRPNRVLVVLFLILNKKKSKLCVCIGLTPLIVRENIRNLANCNVLEYVCNRKSTNAKQNKNTS